MFANDAILPGAYVKTVSACKISLHASGVISVGDVSMSRLLVENKGCV